VTTCRSCDAPVIWLTLRPGGKRMPVDAEPADDGNILADLVAGMGVVVPASELEYMKEATPDEPFYRSHFSTCPDADGWRRRRR
jgi:hypothetical protein